MISFIEIKNKEDVDNTIKLFDNKECDVVIGEYRFLKEFINKNKFVKFTIYDNKKIICTTKYLCEVYDTIIDKYLENICTRIQFDKDGLKLSGEDMLLMQIVKNSYMNS